MLKYFTQEEVKQLGKLIEEYYSDRKSTRYPYINKKPPALYERQIRIMLGRYIGLANRVDCKKGMLIKE